MPVEIISVKELSKVYRVPERESGLIASVKSLVNKKYRNVEAVHKISFNIDAGEIVGFIGQNGAGKTTTLKMLSGLLHPSNGSAKVMGFVPWKREKAYLSRISMVLGNKSQMLWDIPPLDTFQVLAEIYRIPNNEYKDTLDELVELLKMKELLNKPVRNLSLGERMKCELVAGLLHRPAVMYLDEPTLGLDISMQNRLRIFLSEYNRKSGVTIMLTSHYMVDVVTLCPRVILIHHGRLIYDGNLQGLADHLAPFKLIKITLDNETSIIENILDLPEGSELISREGPCLTLRVNQGKTPEITSILLNSFPVVDLSIENPPIEAVIDQIYQEGEV